MVPSPMTPARPLPSRKRQTPFSRRLTSTDRLCPVSRGRTSSESRLRRLSPSSSNLTCIQEPGNNCRARALPSLRGRRRHARAGHSQGTRRARVTDRELLRVRRDYGCGDGLPDEHPLTYQRLDSCVCSGSMFSITREDGCGRAASRKSILDEDAPV